ncbi:MAG TPA: hypothetical protein VFO03_12520 [Gaiellaceae bacterium]|nr:hypothetical protein [Gaiellaceae bacterium]
MRADSPKSLPYALRIALIVVLGLWAAAALAEPSGTQLRVVVVPGLETGDLSALEGRGAVGLLVPDAGPRTSAARARAALERGAIRNSLLGGLPEGNPRLQVETAATVPAGDAIVLALPRGGGQPNDRRYPIAVLGKGYRGLLTSDSTRIPGLVSIADVAPTALGEKRALGSVSAADPVERLAQLDDRIRANHDAEPVVLLLSLALVVAVAAFLPAAALPAFAAVLLANLVLGALGSTEVWVDALAVVLAVGVALPLARAAPVVQGLLLAGVLAAYLVAMAADERWVALSPLGPRQNDRFYGLSNLLATLLLVPALAGAILLGRRFGWWAFLGVAALAVATVGGSAFGANGGEVVVFVVAFLVLAALEHGLDRRLAIGATVVAAILALALVAGGPSHVTDSIADGPAGLAGDLGDSVRISFERATAGAGDALLVLGGIAALVALALRERRPVLLALLAGLGVSLLVNDSPTDVVLAGLACYVVLSSAPALARPVREGPQPAPRAQKARSPQAARP